MRQQVEIVQMRVASKCLLASLVLVGFVSVLTGGGAIVLAQEEGHGADAGGGHTGGAGGGHSGGGGAGEGGGHSGGGGAGQGGGHSGGGESGGEKLQHGLRAGHEGHASGQHVEAAPQGRGAGESKGKGYAVSRRFAGGAGIWGGNQVPEGIENNGGGEGEGPVYRFRYWGGWNIPVIPDEPPIGGGGSAASFNVLTGDARCEDISPGVIEPLSEKNWARLDAAYDLLRDPVKPPKPRARQASLFTLAVYQFELLAPKSDARAAAMYLAHVAKVPLTPTLVDKVNWRLCIAPKQRGATTELTKLARSEQAALQTSGR
ncbi:MAG: hypothetical protein GC151_15155 [Betaproteobacteria bacterium]|nr:hypothetical protein [Betaproteobacteria bacterium]